MASYVITPSGMRVHIKGNSDAGTLCGRKVIRLAASKDDKKMTCTRCEDVLRQILA